jgi:hypothetical protein
MYPVSLDLAGIYVLALVIWGEKKIKEGDAG